ncbi:MAG TPA: SDR family NAD(P)-dependent oxidoreductase [Dehalococcoidia bacterium]|nr:SDR family NAD(P)-dependent oxidoreductase [Dehalococcoidia bacterium]
MAETAVGLAGRRALVLGAGTAAGRAAALALAEAGADVAVAAGSLDGDEVMAVRRVRRAVEAAGRRAAEYAFDLALGQNVRVSTRQVAKEMGGLDLLIYAADAFLRRPTEKTSDAEWTRVLGVNLSGAFYACRAALGEMAAHGGRIVLLSSVLAERGEAESAAYCAAKAGLTGLVRAIALEVAERGITINAFALSAPGGGESEAELAALGRLIVQLASDAGATTTGNVLQIGSAGTSAFPAGGHRSE